MSKQSHKDKSHSQHHGHTPPAGKNKAALSWHHFHAPVKPATKSHDHAQSLAARAPEPTQRATPEPLITRDAEGLSTPLASGTFQSFEELIRHLTR